MAVLGSIGEGGCGECENCGCGKLVGMCGKRGCEGVWKL